MQGFPILDAMQPAVLKARASGAITLLLAALVGGAIAGSTLWAYQGRLVFQPDRSLHAGPADFPFRIFDVEVPVHSPGKPAQALRAWWIPSANPDASVVLYLHGNDGN